MSRNQYLTQLNSLQEAKAEVLTLHEERTKVLAEAAAQLNDLNRQAINLQAELVGLRETISYRTVKAPIDGQIFDLKLSRSTVINASLPVLKIVPSNRLEASVQIPDSDVGFVSIGMPASISVDSFPSGEFGYLYGKVVSLGSDALKPDALNQAYRFPATVSLDKQRVESGGKPLNLQSGMSVTANIKLRSRPVITIVSDMFTKQLEGVKRFR
jgi:HlyD family secretion protein